eukprot:gene3477-biopygen7435
MIYREIWKEYGGTSLTGQREITKCWESPTDWLTDSLCRAHRPPPHTHRSAQAAQRSARRAAKRPGSGAAAKPVGHEIGIATQWRCRVDLCTRQREMQKL